MESIFEYRLSGYIYKLIIENELTCDRKLEKTLYSIYKINNYRNNLLKQQLYDLNNKFEQLGIDRLWLKGAREMILSNIDLGMRKMVDLDILISPKDYYLTLNKDLDLIYGTYDREGHFFNPDQESIEYALKNKTYEYPAMTKRINIDAKSLEPFTPNINSHILNRFRIFWDDEKKTYFTDLILNVHFDLSEDFHNDLLLKNGFVPVMSDFDDMWYLMYKTYYEIILGNSKDLQRLIETIIKLKTSPYSLSELEKNIKKRYPEFYNSELFFYFLEF